MRIRTKMNYDDDDVEALKSPFSRVYLCPKTEHIISCTMGLRYPIDVDALKKAFADSIIIKHPRFSSLMVRNKAGEYWQKTQVNIDDHFLVVDHPTPPTAEGGDVENGDIEAAVNAYLADIAVSTPLSLKKPLWEVHLLMALNCIVFRVHHTLGDGASLMSMLQACFGKERESSEEREKNGGSVKRTGGRESRKWRDGGVWGMAKTVWFTLVFAIKYLLRLLWVKDERNVIYGGDGVELWPRKLETVKFELQDFKVVKQAIPNATINDVLLGVIGSGLSKYLQQESPKALVHGLQLTGLVLVNLRSNSGFQKMEDIMKTNTWWWSSSWGNKTGLVLQPVKCCEGLHPMDHVKKMKAFMDQKKQSYEAQIPYIFLQIFASLFGSKVASWCTHRILCNTSLLVSNIMGPLEEIAIADNPVTFLRVNISSLPQALTIHLVSYAGKADLQMMVAKDIITEPKLLAKCFHESLLEMKSYVTNSNK